MGSARQRVRYWAALTLLRSLMSSPAAAAKAFAVREQKLAERAADAEEQEDLRERETMDPVDVELTSDTIPDSPGGPTPLKRAAIPKSPKLLTFSCL